MDVSVLILKRSLWLKNMVNAGYVNTLICQRRTYADREVEKSIKLNRAQVNLSKVHYFF